MTRSRSLFPYGSDILFILCIKRRMEVLVVKGANMVTIPPAKTETQLLMVGDAVALITTFLQVSHSTVSRIRFNGEASGGKEFNVIHLCVVCTMECHSRRRSNVD